MRAERLSRLSGTGLVLASFLGTIPGALFTSVGLARLLPLETETRFAIGFGLSFIVWVAAASVVWLSRSGLRALGWSALFALVGAVAGGYVP